jgi:hypothetical protein
MFSSCGHIPLAQFAFGRQCIGHAMELLEFFQPVIDARLRRLAAQHLYPKFEENNPAESAFCGQLPTQA